MGGKPSVIHDAGGAQGLNISIQIQSTESKDLASPKLTENFNVFGLHKYSGSDISIIKILFTNTKNRPKAASCLVLVHAASPERVCLKKSLRLVQSLQA